MKRQLISFILGTFLSTFCFAQVALPPANDSCHTATIMTPSLLGDIDTFDLTNASSSMLGCGDDNDVWMKFQMPASGGLEIETSTSSGSYNQYFRVFTGGCTSLSAYSCTGNCDYYNASNCGDYLRIVDPSLAGDSLWVRFSNRFSSSALVEFSVSLKEIPTSEFVPNDSCQAAIDLSSSLTGIADTFTLVNSIAESTLPACGIDEDVWFKFEVPSSGGFSISTDNLDNTWNQFFRVYENGCASLDPYECTGTCNYYSSSNCDDNLTLIDPNIAGDTLWVRVTRRFSSQVNSAFGLTLDEITTADFVQNDSCPTAAVLTPSIGTVIDTFTLVNSTVELPASPCGDDQDVWFKFEVPSSGAFEVSTYRMDLTYNPYVNIYENGCASLLAYSCDSNCNFLNTARTCSDEVRIVDSSLAGDTLWMRVSKRFNLYELDDFGISLREIPSAELKSNDDCINAMPLQVSSGSCLLDTFDNINTTHSTVPTGTCNGYSGSDVWFKFAMPASDDAFIEMSQVDNVSSNFRITAFSGGCASLFEEACNSAGSYPDLNVRGLGLAGDSIWLHVYQGFEDWEGDTFGLCIRDTVLPALRVAVGDYEKTSSCPTINGAGWYDLIDSSNNLVASLNPSGNYLGNTCFGVRIEDSITAVRTAQDTLGNTVYVAPRNFYISPNRRDRSAQVRLYFKEREMEIWRDSLSNLGLAVGPSLLAFLQDSLRISKTDGSTLGFLGGPNPIQINPIVTELNDSIFVAEFSVTGFSNFIPNFNPGNAPIPVPVEWMYFDGKTRNELNVLSWATASEIDCSHFEVQRSSDAKEFVTVGIVQGNGSTNTVSNYDFKDQRSNLAKTYYRLKQIDYNGSYEFSNVVVLSGKNTLAVTPNPFKDEVTISNGKEDIEKIQIVNLYGQVVYEEVVNASNTNLRLHTKLPAGVYVLRVINGRSIEEKRIIKY